MPAWSDVVAAAADLPSAEEATTYGSAPAIKVRKKVACWYRDNPEALVVRVEDVAEKEALIAGDPGVFFTTDHYDGHAYVLVHLEKIDRATLAELVEDAWRLVAAKTVVAAYDAEHEDAS